MIRRFCLYGFLKNQRYFEPFLLLFLLGKGLDFFAIGLLIACRDLVVNLLEVPSGALADLYGRRRSMMLSFVAYLVSFALFSWADSLPGLFFAMGAYGVGEAFRSGTHKAMIFDWLRREGRAGEKAKIYGLTRSWSQLGSAVSVWIAVLLVLVDGGYDRLFWFTMVPNALSLVNFLGYPAFLDATPERGERSVKRHLGRALRQCFGVPRLRALLFESMLQRGTWQSGKDYLQPMVQQLVFTLPFLALAPATGEVEDPLAPTALALGVLYSVMHLLSAAASLRSDRVRRLVGGTGRFVFGTFLITAAAYLTLIPVGLATDGELPGGPAAFLVALLFPLLGVLQNLWKPVYLERVDAASDAQLGATVLSVEGQAKALAVVLFAPALGAAVDAVGFTAVGGFGLMTSVLVLGLVGRPSR